MGILNQEISVEEIAQILDEILKNTLLINTDLWGQDKYNQNFLEPRAQMRARHLLKLYFEIEECFGISIQEKDIVSGAFNSINNISVILYSEMKNA